MRICYFGDDITGVNRAPVGDEQVIELLHSECGWAIDRPHQYKIVGGKLVKREQQDISNIELQAATAKLRGEIISAIEIEASRRVASAGQFLNTSQALQQIMEAIDILCKKIDNQATQQEISQLSTFRGRKNESKRLRKREEDLKGWAQDATIEELNNFITTNDSNWL